MYSFVVFSLNCLRKNSTRVFKQNSLQTIHVYTNQHDAPPPYFRPLNALEPYFTRPYMALSGVKKDGGIAFYLRYSHKLSIRRNEAK